jgi:DNA-binding response OmpR family regulator
MSTALSILVVEDDPDIGSVLEVIFESEGYRVHWAPLALEALEVVSKDPPDLITLDLNLPDLPGEEVLQRLAGDASHSQIPVVVLSAYTARLQSTPQVVRVMTKPFNLDDLLETAQAALEG